MKEKDRKYCDDTIGNKAVKNALAWATIWTS